MITSIFVALGLPSSAKDVTTTVQAAGFSKDQDISGQTVISVTCLRTFTLLLATVVAALKKKLAKVETSLGKPFVSIRVCSKPNPVEGRRKSKGESQDRIDDSKYE